MQSRLAALVLLAASCGDNRTSAPDGATPDAPRIDGEIDAPSDAVVDALLDAAIDAPPDANPADLVTVTAIFNGQAVAGDTVYFLAPDDTLIAEAATDANGVASASMPAGGSVTRVSFDGTTGTLQSWLGVKPGDALRSADFDNGVAPIPEQITATVPSDPDPAASLVYVSTTCGAQGVFDPPTVQLYLRCSPGTSDFLVFSRTVTGEALDAFLVPDVAFANGDVVALTGTFAPFDDVPITVSGLPSTAPSINAQQLWVDNFMFQDTATATVTGGSATATLRDLVGSGGRRLVEASFWPASHTSALVVSWGPPAASYAFDLTGKVMAAITSAPTIDVSSSRVTWSLGATGNVPDFTIVNTQTTVGAVQWTWDLAGPGDPAGGLHIPVIPTDLYDFSPRTGGLSRVQGANSTVEDGGYDARRATIFDDTVPTTNTAPAGFFLVYSATP